ncbi:MAG: ECF transporter S component [Muribaculaceae bacterium]|nr:ECF transporter S component [Muribaculaceae bacterium]
MQTTSIQLHTLPFRSVKTYTFSLVFILGNILLPRLVHLIPQGGLTWLPIYFFTLVGAYMYGWKVGILTALLSPVINSLLFGMPATEALPAILVKSALLASFAGVAASRFHKVSLPLLARVVLGYQMFGTLAEWALCGDFLLACRDFRIGLPGMLLQIFGGYVIIQALKKY